MKLTEIQLAQIDAYLAAHRDEIVQTLFELIRIPSVKAEPKPHAPFGESCAAALEAAHRLYEREGLATKKTDSYALAYYGSGAHTLGVFAHSDVVPASAHFSQIPQCLPCRFLRWNRCITSVFRQTEVLTPEAF